MLTETQRNSLYDTHRRVLDRIAAAAVRSGRTSDAVKLVAVTKTATVEQIAALYAMGQLDLGENRVQQLTLRAQELARTLGEQESSPRWHMIGHLQRNKVRQVLPHVCLVHSVDSLRLAAEIEDAAAELERVVDVLIQVNIAGEEQKYGVSAEVAFELGSQIAHMQHIRLRGIMTMAPYADDPQASRPVFAEASKLYEELARMLPSTDDLDLLSMGMSNDFEVAIEEGATMVRVGSALFEE